MIKLISIFKRGFYDFCFFLFGLTCCVVLMVQANKHGYPKSYQAGMIGVPQLIQSEPVTPSWASKLPLGFNIWKGSQPSATELAEFLRAHQVRYVVRLNGNQEGSMTHAEEAAVCASASKDLGYQITFLYINIEAKGDRLNPLALKKIRKRHQWRCTDSLPTRLPPCWGRGGAGSCRSWSLLVPYYRFLGLDCLSRPPR